DIAYKVRATQDFVDSGYSSFAIRYPAERADPTFDFFPGMDPFVHAVGKAHMYVFPFQYTLLVAPFFALWGLSGINFPTLILALSLLYGCYLLGRHIGLTPIWNSVFVGA